jgi:hypothetical protein
MGARAICPRVRGVSVGTFGWRIRVGAAAVHARLNRIENVAAVELSCRDEVQRGNQQTDPTGDEDRMGKHPACVVDQV